MKHTIDGVQFETSEERVKAGDYMVVNNPHPLSSLKNIVRKCEFIHSNGSIQPYQNGNLSLSEWSQTWCKPVIWSSDPTIQQYIENRK